MPPLSVDVTYSFRSQVFISVPNESFNPFTATMSLENYQ